MENNFMKKEVASASIEDVLGIDSGRQDDGSPGKPKRRVEEYVASGRLDKSTWPLLALSIPVASILVAYIRFRLVGDSGTVFLTQAIIGAAVGALMFPALQLGKCRNTKIAGTAALLATLLSYIAHTGFMAASERPEYVAYYTEDVARSRKISTQQAHAVVENGLTPLRYARMWFGDRAINGVTLSNSSSSSSSSRLRDSGTRITGLGYYAFELAECLLAAFFAFIISSNIAGRRFSETHDSWYRKKKLSRFKSEQIPAVLDLIEQDSWGAAGTLIKSSNGGSNKDNGTINLYQVPGQEEGIVSLTRTSGKQSHLLFEAFIPEEDMRQLKNAS